MDSLPSTPIYISPHYDDICFSLGMTAKASGGGHLVNVFTDCNYIATSAKTSTSVADLRDKEDVEFAKACGLQRHNLGLAEATVKGLAPFDFTDIEGEVEALDKPLVQLLLALSGAETEIFCPLGVGRHRNHLSVFLAVAKSYAALAAKAKIYFYEDLPYASDIASRREAIARLACCFPPQRTLRHAHQLDRQEMREKLGLVSLYPSQHRGSVEEKDFTPSEPATPFPHEAFWETSA